MLWTCHNDYDTATVNVPNSGPVLELGGDDRCEVVGDDGVALGGGVGAVGEVRRAQPAGRAHVVDLGVAGAVAGADGGLGLGDVPLLERLHDEQPGVRIPGTDVAQERGVRRLELSTGHAVSEVVRAEVDDDRGGLVAGEVPGLTARAVGVEELGALTDAAGPGDQAVPGTGDLGVAQVQQLTGLPAVGVQGQSAGLGPGGDRVPDELQQSRGHVRGDGVRPGVQDEAFEDHVAGAVLDAQGVGARGQRPRREVHRAADSRVVDIRAAVEAGVEGDRVAGLDLHRRTGEGRPEVRAGPVGHGRGARTGVPAADVGDVWVGHLPAVGRRRRRRCRGAPSGRDHGDQQQHDRGQCHRHRRPRRPTGP